MKQLSLFLLAVWCWGAGAAEIMPPVPAQWFNDYARVVSPTTAARLNQTLQDFERQTSSQILVAVFPKMESPSSIEDYTVRVAQSWKAGQKDKKNGAVLFVFVQDRKMFIQVGYGLEGALPDAICKRIIEDELKPRFRRDDFDGGLSAGVTAILKATKGEYKGTGQIKSAKPVFWLLDWLVFNRFFPWHLILGLFGLSVLRRLIFGAPQQGTVYRGGGYSSWGSGWGGGGGGWSGGGGGGGGGGFSSGGGSFGGGGAGGSW